jgi:hypothetical protein
LVLAYGLDALADEQVRHIILSQRNVRGAEMIPVCPDREVMRSRFESDAKIEQQTVPIWVSDPQVNIEGLYHKGRSHL